MNLNNLARNIARREGLKTQVNIAQIKEILRITMEELAFASWIDVEKTLKKVREQHIKEMKEEY